MNTRVLLVVGCGGLEVVVDRRVCCVGGCGELEIAVDRSVCWVERFGGYKGTGSVGLRSVG